MARKSEASHQKCFNIAVVGLSGTEKEKGCLGIGKSCLCNRFIRPLADDYNHDHISVLSQTDFSGRIINNEHWLYWGETNKTSDEGYDMSFSVIEQTEFIDDACFQPFKSGKTEPYYKRCAATRLSSAEKMMYICKNQLGIEKEYEQRYLNDGRFCVDGFVCCFDVSEVQGRSIERQVELTALILNSLLRTKKPIVLATTKHDEVCDQYVREAEKLINRKEFKGNVVLIETSAHENVNVDLAFVTCAQITDRTKGKPKNMSFIEASRNLRDRMDSANDAYLSLIRTQITDYRTLWNSTYKKLSQSQDFLNYCELFGQDSAHLTFKRHIKKLKDDYMCRKMQMYLRVLPEVLTELMPDLETIGDQIEWTDIRDRIRSHPDFDQYFIDSPDQTWEEIDIEDGSETRIPFDLLETPEAEQVFIEHRMSLESGERQRELRHQFKQLLQETGYVTPGKSLTEVRILFMGRECYESLGDRDVIEMYEEHQKEITELAKLNFQELLLEHSNLFYQFASLGPGSVITQDDIAKITESLEEDPRYKSLDRLDQDRTLMLLRHLGFTHGPIREHCPVFPNCMDVLIEKYFASRARRPSTGTRNSHFWFSESNNNHLNLVLLGSGGLSEELCSAIKQINETFELEKTRFTLDFRIIAGDVDLPQNAFRTNDFSPKGCFCVYTNHQTLEYVRQSLEKTLLSDLEQEDGLPFHGLPIVILFAANSNTNEKDLLFLREEGQNRAKSLQCPFIDVTNFDSHSSGALFDTECLSQALRALIESIQRRADLLSIYQSVLPEQALNPDIRVLLCMLCGDPFSIEQVMSPFLAQNLYYVTSSHSITIELFIGETKKFVELVATSYHGAQAYRDELLHGFLLFYSCRRKASLASMSAFTDAIPNTPIMIVSFDSSNSNIYYSNHDLELHLLQEGNTLADKLEAHFVTSSPTQQKSSYFIPFLKEVIERKPQIEKAFELEDSEYSSVPPPVPNRQESYHIRSASTDSADNIYEHLADKTADNGELSITSGFVDGPQHSPSDDSEVYASVYNQENGEHLVKPSQIKNRRSLQADLYRQSFPSTESLDRPLSSRRMNSSHPPLPPRRNDLDLSYAPPPYTRAVSPPPSYVSHFSPRLPSHKRTSKLSADETNSSGHSSLLYATDRRRIGAYSDKSLTPFQYHFHLKKSNSLKASAIGTSLSGIGSHSSRLAEDLDPSDEVSDEDDDTVSSGLSGYGAYPPPPEPAPPDYSSRLSMKKTPSLPPSGRMPVQRSFNEGWMERDNRVYDRGSEEWLDNDVYHAYHSQHKMPPPIKPKPGKLNLKQFDNITDAIGRLHVSPRQGSTLPKVGLLNAPLATPESVDLNIDYNKDSIYGRNSQDYYSILQNTISDGKHRVRLNRRNKDSLEKVGSDSDSDWSSLERRERDPYNRAYRKPTPHKKVRKKRGIPVAPPRLPSFEGNSNNFSNKVNNSANNAPKPAGDSPLDPFEPSGRGNTPSDGSDLSNEDNEPIGETQPTVSSKTRPKRSFHLRRRPKPPTQSHSIPETYGESNSPPISSIETNHNNVSPFSLEHSPKQKFDSSLSCITAAQEEDYDPRDATIRQLGKVLKSKSATVITENNEKSVLKKDRDRKKAREDEKLEKRRLKEEERQKRINEKKKKKQKNNSTANGPTLEEFVQSEDNVVPLFVEKCIQFIEEEGLDSEGIYRVPGNRAHVDLLFQKFEEEPNVSIRELDIPVNAVATALKDFFSKRLPPLIPSSMMDELTDLSHYNDKSSRLSNFREFLKSLPNLNFEVIKYVFKHFVKVTDNCRLNSMDSKNLAICWWPTLLPFEFNDMLMFEQMRPHLEDFVQTMIDQFPFLFEATDDVLLVV